MGFLWKRGFLWLSLICAAPALAKDPEPFGCDAALATASFSALQADLPELAQPAIKVNTFKVFRYFRWRRLSPSRWVGWDGRVAFEIRAGPKIYANRRSRSLQFRIGLYAQPLEAWVQKVERVRDSFFELERPDLRFVITRHKDHIEIRSRGFDLSEITAFDFIERLAGR